MIDEETIRIISGDPPLCDNWASGQCYYPDGFRKCTLTQEEKEKLPDCICKPGNTETICDKCRPDSVLFDSKPSWFKKETDSDTNEV